MRRLIAYLTLLTLALPGLAAEQRDDPAHAEDRQGKATAALTSILFDHDADEFTSYRVRTDGFVEVTFANNTPDAIYSRILEDLRRHPDIHGVIAGRGGPACKRF